MAKKKKYIVLARNPGIQQQGLTTDKGHRSFGEKSALWISDPAEAQEIETQYGMKGSRDVAVTTDQQYEWSLNNEGGNGTRMDNIHHYTFQGVDNSLFKVWVLRNGKLVRTTKAQAQAKGYKIIAETRSRPEIGGGDHEKKKAKRI